MARITDDELVSICSQEIESASGYTSGELSKQRADAMDYYLGEPYGDEVEGRSQVVTTEVRDTVESILPSLCRIFCDADNMIEFDPVGPEDEDLASQETDMVNHAFWKMNEGFFNVYTFCKDALLSKTGNLKVWWDDSEGEEREEYEGLDDIQLGQLMTDDTVDREVIEYDQTEEGHNVVFLTKGRGKIRIEPVPPEEFGVRRDARSPYASHHEFVYHRVRKSYSDLIAAGYDRKTIEQIPDSDDDDTQERLARRHLSDETDMLSAGGHKSTRNYWITECYIRVDRDDDGIAELLKVTIAAGANSTISGATLLDVEEVDSIPFFTAAPSILTHKFYGLSIADLVMDIQKIKSNLLRQILDNAYLANNQRTAANERVNIDDLLTNRPGGIVRIDGEGDIGGSLTPIPSTPLPPETFGLLEYLDEIRKDRTGSGDEVAGLDAKSLANVNSSVAALAYDAARAKIELVARILAEVGFKPLFKHVHELLLKHQDKSQVMRLRGQWVEVNPSEWRKRENVTVCVGLGIASRERRLVALDAIAERQSQIVAGGGFGTLLLPEHLYAQLHDHAEALGMEPGRYYQDPKELPPKQPEGPSAQEQAMLMTAQAQMGAAQAQNDRNKVDMAKAQADVQIRQMELAASQRELELRGQTEALKGDLAELKSQREMAEKQGKAMLDAEIKVREQEIKINESRMKDNQETLKREVDMYKAILQSGTTLTAEQMKIAGAAEGGLVGELQAIQDRTAQMVEGAFSALADALRGELGGVREQFGEVQAKLIEQAETLNAPRAIERDANGLIVSIGGKPIARDESGRVVSVG